MSVRYFFFKLLEVRSRGMYVGLPCTRTPKKYRRKGKSSSTWGYDGVCSKVEGQKWRGSRHEHLLFNLYLRKAHSIQTIKFCFNSEQAAFRFQFSQEARMYTMPLIFVAFPESEDNQHKCYLFRNVGAARIWLCQYPKSSQLIIFIAQCWAKWFALNL